MSAPTGLVLPPFGIGTPLFVETYSSMAALTTGNPTADRATLVYVGRLGKRCRASKFHIYVGTPAGDVDVAVGTLSGTTFTRLGSSGAVAVSGSSAVQSIDPSATLWLPEGVNLWLGAGFSSASAAVGRSTPTAVVGAVYSRVVYAASQVPVDASFTITAGTAFIPWVGMTLAES